MNPQQKHQAHLFRTGSPVECGIAGGLAFFFFAWATIESTQIIVLGTLFCSFAAFVIADLQNEKQGRQKLDAVLETLPIPFELASEPGFYKEFTKIATSLTKIVRHDDRLFHDLSRSRLESIADEVDNFGTRSGRFRRDRNLRTAYERVLATLHVKSYFSVAWARTNEYWNDMRRAAEHAIQLRPDRQGISHRARSHPVGRTLAVR